MPSWNELFNSVQTVNVIEDKKRQFLQQLSEYTKRNTIVYFSSWQQKTGIQTPLFSIDDDDRNGFMNALHGMDKTKGLDLILHTPGGDLAATQSIVDYVFSYFEGNIRTIIPLIAMSAGTMIACSSKTIVMGKQSNLGPIDPQIAGMPANEYIDLLEQAKKDLQNGENREYWKLTLEKYPPTFFGLCKNAIKSSNKMLAEWLKRSMMRDCSDADIDTTVKYLSDYHSHFQHNTRLSISKLREETKLKIVELEDDQRLQELVLSLYHCYQIMAGTSNACKIIENQNGKKFIKQLERY